MPRNLEHRLRRLELASSGPATVEIWITQEDGTVSGPNGEHITEEAFLRLYSAGSSGVILATATTDAGL